MLQISKRKLFFIGGLILLIILFFISLSVSNHKRAQFLEAENHTLRIKLAESQANCDHLVKQNYYLCDAVKCVSDGLHIQTKSIIELTKSIQPNFVPIIVRDTIYGNDALAPYRSKGTSTNSRGF